VLFRSPGNLKRYDDEMFVVDGSNLTIKRFGLDGHFLGEIGNGIGQGPGELSSIADYAVRGDNIWVLDHRSRKVTRFSRAGTYISTFYIDCACLRIATLDTAVVLLDLMKPEPFRLFSFAGSESQSFGLGMTDQSANPLGFDGDLNVSSSGHLFYLARYAGYIVDLGAPDRPRFMQLIDEQPFPVPDDVRKPSGQVRYFAPNQPLTMRGFALSGDTASVLTQLAPSGQLVERRLDRYLIDTGRYIGSIRLPERAGK